MSNEFLFKLNLNAQRLISRTFLAALFLGAIYTLAISQSYFREIGYKSQFSEPARELFQSGTPMTTNKQVHFQETRKKISGGKDVTNLQINFQDSGTKAPAGWLIDYGQPFGARSSVGQQTGNTYGWKRLSDGTPLDLRAYGRRRAAPADTLLATLMHMQASNTPEGVWEAQVANGNYDVTVSVGDGSFLDSRHTIKVEGVPAITSFVPTSSERFRTATVTVTVSDGLLTIDASGGINTKINYVSMREKIVSALTHSILFSQALQSAEVEQGHTQDLLEYITTSDSNPVSVQLNAEDESGVVPAWLTVNGKLLDGEGYTTGSEITFSLDATNLSTGKYTARVTASADNYKSGVLDLQFTVKAGSTGTLASLKVNFQDSAAKTPVGWLTDFGQPFGLRSSGNQGIGNTYGWVSRRDNKPLDLRAYGRRRSAPADTLLATLMQMQASNAPEGVWEAQVANGNYDVTVSVGDGAYLDSKHFIKVEGVETIVNFAPTTSIRFRTATVSVTVADGLLTVDADGGSNTKINYISIRPSTSRRPSVVVLNPENGSQNVSDLTSVSTSILNLPNGGIDNSTLTAHTVYLEEENTRTIVAANVNGTGGGDAITLVPQAPLKLNTSYVFNITDGVKDLSGASFIPYASTFTTGSVATGKLNNVKFTRVPQPNTAGNHSTLTIGPDGKLYALSIDGVIKRFVINKDGTLQNPELLYSLQDAYGARQQRLAIGLAFDPSSTASNLIAYITHSSYVFQHAPEWDGRLTRLSGANLQNAKDLLIHLPRSAKDHLPNSLAFGPDGGLYLALGSNSAMGREDKTWGNRQENLLSGTVLRLDLQKLPATLPLDVKTPEGGGTYDPFAVGAPLTIFASGVRNAYDLVWHSNGELYVPTNGSAAGGNTPASVTGTRRPDGSFYSGPAVPALTNVPQTQKDFLFRVRKGGYYGHPNSLRGEYVMNGGNPTSAIDPAQVDAYPIGTQPDANWTGYSFDFQTNKSPNGIIEYKSNAFGGALKGKLLVVRYSQNDDIITLTPGGANNDIVSYIEGAAIEGFTGFVDPLDLIEDTRTGNIYVSEYGGSGTITLLQSDIGASVPESSISVSPVRLFDNDVSGGAAGPNRPITIKNLSDTGVLTVSRIFLNGTNSDQFIFGGLPDFPKRILPKDSVSFTIAFHPTSTGLKTAGITIISDDAVSPSLQVALRALGTAGTAGNGEPSLQAILNLFEIPVTVGDDNVSSTVIHSNATMQKAPLLGEEVGMQNFVKAEDGLVTIEPLAVFGPTASNPVLESGWYRSGDSTSRTPLVAVANTPVSNAQTVNVAASGVFSFDPGSKPFGFYTRWPFFGNRLVYSEDHLNTFTGSIPHHVRVYPYRDKNGIVPFTYLVAVEDNTSGFDYQDFVFIVKNVKAVQTTNTVVPAIADAYVWDGSANTNFGSDTSLIVRGTPTAGTVRSSYLKFPLNNLVDIISAKLRVYGQNLENASTAAILVSGVENDSWTESGITWNNAPAPLPAAINSFSIDHTGRYYEVDVTAFVKNQFGKDKMVSLLISDTARQSQTLSFNSREHIRFQPQLVIETSGSLPASNSQLFVENLNRFPSNDYLVASRVQIPRTADSITYNKDHDTLRLRLHNKGINPLVIRDLVISNSANWKIIMLRGNPYDFETALPLTINPGSSVDVQIKFTAFIPNNIRTRLFSDELTIVSNDVQKPFKTVYLKGLWQREGEGAREPTAQEIITAFGFKTLTGFGAVDPDSGENNKAKGDEVLSSYFVRVDPSRPVTVRQIAAYHNCCNQPDTIRWYRKGSPTTLATVATHLAEDAQTLLPRRSKGNTYLPAEGAFYPTVPFGLRIGKQDWSDTLLNADRKIRIRVWKAISPDGRVIPDSYIVAGDGLEADTSDYDYNDNLYFISNIRPEHGPASTSTLASSPSAVDFGERLLFTTGTVTLNLQNLGQIYAGGIQDPDIKISAIAVVGENCGEFAADNPLKTNLQAQETTTITVAFKPQNEGLKNADLLIYYNSGGSPLRVPLFGIAKPLGRFVAVPYRIKSGSTTGVTVNGKTYIADTAYAFDNLYYSGNTRLAQIHGTDEDVLYLKELSSNGDRRPFRYEIPIQNGNYWVRLHFAETYWGVPGGNLNGGAGSRVMSIRLENELRIINLDVAGAVGSAAAYTRNIPVTVRDGKLNIDFSASANRPTVAAVEVYQFTSGVSAISPSARELSLNDQPTAANFEKPRVFPNPAHNQFTIEFPTIYRGTINLQLTDVSGKVFELGKAHLRPGGVNMQVDLTRLSLPSGAYFLRIISEGGKTDIIKLLIQ